MVRGSKGLIQTYDALLERIDEHSAFLAELIKKVRAYNRNISRHPFGFAEGRALMTALLETGTASLIMKSEDVDNHPELLWILADHMKKDPDRERSGIALTGLAWFYKTLFGMGLIGSRFDDYRIAITDHLHRSSVFVSFLRDSYESSETTFTIQYDPHMKSALVSVSYRGSYLQDITIRHFGMARRKWRRSKDDVSFIVHEAGAWMDNQGEPINSCEELTATRLQETIDHFIDTYKGHRREDALRYVFDIYQLAITDNPDYPFFEDSYLWRREMVFDLTLPMKLAQGYQFVPLGSSDNPPHEKVLFLLDASERKFSNTHRFSVIACDYSSVRTDHYRSIIVNYAAETSCRRFNNPRTFFTWIENRKRRDGDFDATLTHFSTNEAYAFRAFVSRKYRDNGTRNGIFGTTKSILRWACDKGLITVDHDAWEAFKWCRTRKRAKKSNARCLSNLELAAIEETLERMAEKDVKALMALFVFQIQLFVDTRPIELCDMNLNHFHLNADGTATYFAIEKNSGSDPVEILYPPTAASTILDAIDATAKTRASCPLDCANRLFLYNAGPNKADGFMVLSVDAYNTQLKKASELAGLNICVVSSFVRDTYMTSIQRFCHEHGLLGLQRMVLTKHARRQTINNYLDINQSDFLTKANRLTFGTIKRD